MTREELVQLSTDELITLVLRQGEILLLLQEQIHLLSERVAQLEAHLAGRKPPKGKAAMGCVRPNVAKPAAEQQKPRKKRMQGFARKREESTHYVQHAVAKCPDCGCTLRGGYIRRRRQVLHIPVVPVQVIEHEIIARQCPQCGREAVPKVDLTAEVVGQHRVSAQTMSLVTTLREVGRVPLRTIQWYLRALHGLKLSLGELVAILHDVAKQGRATLERLKGQIRASPVVHGDETGWRENGRNGYIWTFSTPQIRYFLYRQSRSGKVVTEVLSEAFEGHLVSDFYGGYNRMEGRHQRCWTHLLRDIHELREEHPDDTVLQRWARRVYRLFLWAKAFHSGDAERRVRAQHLFERLLSGLCQPFLQGQRPQRTLCVRIERFLPELFAFVADPRVPADNNAAERSLRPLVVSRKISGGTRSPEGSNTKMVLASLFGTWHVQGLNPFESCHNLLLSPQV